MNITEFQKSRFGLFIHWGIYSIPARGEWVRSNEEMKEEDLKEVVKISIFTKNKESCEKLFQKIPDSLTGFMYKNYHLDLYNGEISIKGITKATGLKQITNYLNKAIEATVAIGDSLNDLDILQAAGLSICMGNGADECKKSS